MQWKKILSTSDRIPAYPVVQELAEQSIYSGDPKPKIGLVIGEGDLAFRVLEIASSRFECHVCFLEGTNYKRSVQNKLAINIFKANLTQIRKILKFFESHEVGRIVMVGAISRPGILSLAFADAEFKSLIKKIQSSGDASAGKILIQYLESRGFSVLGCHQVAPEIMIPRGIFVGDVNRFLEDARIGFLAIKIGSPFDLFQSVAIKNGQLVAVEDIFGTDKLISRFHKSGLGGLTLVKAKKSTQDPRFDLPCVGRKTLEIMSKHGFDALIVEADNVICEDLAGMIKIAAQRNITFASVTTDQILGSDNQRTIQEVLKLADNLISAKAACSVDDQATKVEKEAE